MEFVTEILFYLVFIPNVDNYFDRGAELWALYFEGLANKTL